MSEQREGGPSPGGFSELVHAYRVGTDERRFQESVELAELFAAIESDHDRQRILEFARELANRAPR